MRDTEAMNDTPTPEPGDVVEILPGEGRYYVAHDSPKRGIIDGHYREGGPLIVVVNVDGGAAYRDHGHVSVSGGPCPVVQPEALRHKGTTTARFWRFKDGFRRLGVLDAEAYELEVNLWEWA